MRGKTVLVTGANNGIGLETARALAASDAHLILVCRDQRRGAAARDDIVRIANGGKVPGVRSAEPARATTAAAEPTVAGEARSFPANPLDRLTPREREGLDLVAAGATNRAVAATLFISEKTVSVHVTNLMAELGVSSRLQALVLAHALSLSEPASTTPR